MDVKHGRFTRHNRITCKNTKVLRSIFGPFIDTNTGEWKIKNNAEIKKWDLSKTKHGGWNNEKTALMHGEKSNHLCT